MSAEQTLIYLDSSAIVKLAVAEPESPALRHHLSRHQTLASSALARVEVARALLPSGLEAVARGREVLGYLELLRLTDQVLSDAAGLEPPQLRSLDAIHLASARLLGPSVQQIVTYDKRMAAAAEAGGWKVASPGWSRERE
jgi:predicted nucleic acid-binding protein